MLGHKLYMLGIYVGSQTIYVLDICVGSHVVYVLGIYVGSQTIYVLGICVGSHVIYVLGIYVGSHTIYVLGICVGSHVVYVLGICWVTNLLAPSPPALTHSFNCTQHGLTNKLLVSRCNLLARTLTICAKIRGWRRNPRTARWPLVPSPTGGSKRKQYPAAMKS